MKFSPQKYFKSTFKSNLICLYNADSANAKPISGNIFPKQQTFLQISGVCYSEAIWFLVSFRPGNFLCGDSSDF